MLTMAAFQFGDPVLLLVEMEAANGTLHGNIRGESERASVSGKGIGIRFAGVSGVLLGAAEVHQE